MANVKIVKRTEMRPVEIDEVQLNLSSEEADFLLGLLGRCTGSHSWTIYDALAGIVEEGPITYKLRNKLEIIDCN
jgi:hypothetical protein